ncbi:MAG: hypothetical protein EAZ31_00920, partial [Cytophagia bacterium]
MSFINYVTQIQIDFGAVKLLQAECERVGIRKPLIVTDAGVKAAGVLQKALDALPGLPVIPAAIPAGMKPIRKV